jgi:hypothetical protein
MGEFILALVFLGVVACIEECCQGRRKTDATWD